MTRLPLPAMYALTNGERVLPLFLHYHNGVPSIAQFRTNALRFIHRALNALTGYAARDHTCRRSQRASGTAADGVSNPPRYPHHGWPRWHCYRRRSGSVRRAYA